jgi:ABC-type transporter Mla subunit MlaD
MEKETLPSMGPLCKGLRATTASLRAGAKLGDSLGRAAPVHASTALQLDRCVVQLHACAASARHLGDVDDTVEAQRAALGQTQGALGDMRHDLMGLWAELQR